MCVRAAVVECAAGTILVHVVIGDEVPITVRGLNVDVVATVHGHVDRVQLNVVATRGVSEVDTVRSC